MADLYLALGSNVEPRRHLTQALELLGARYALLRVSAWFHTLPWGVTQQPWFLNCAAHVVTGEAPLQVLEFTQRVERLLGRRRVLRHGPRTIDIDLLLYGGLVRAGPRLTLPHPGLRARDQPNSSVMGTMKMESVVTAAAWRTTFEHIAQPTAAHP